MISSPASARATRREKCVLASWMETAFTDRMLVGLVRLVHFAAEMPSTAAAPAVAGAAWELRRRGRQRERQRLAVGAGAQRVGGADRLLERDPDRVVGARAVV